MDPKAVLSSGARTALPDSAFACPEKRLYPHHHADGSIDLPHLRAALSRVGDPANDQCGKAHLETHARDEGLGERGDRGKAMLPMKAASLGDDEQQAWFAGRIARRLLAIPFGGPIPSPRHARGVDLDGETFTERTDIFGPHRALRQTRERFVDFHHGTDPLGVMTGALVGKAILDDEPEEDGWWVDFWFKAGERRVKLIKALADRGAQLFGSSFPVRPDVKKAADGEILVWPFLVETVSTSPQNTYSVFRPAKAVLEDAAIAGLELDGGYRALLEQVALESDLRLPSLAGGDAAKAGRDPLDPADNPAIAAALERLGVVVDQSVEAGHELATRIRG